MSNRRLNRDHVATTSASPIEEAMLAGEGDTKLAERFGSAESRSRITAGSASLRD